MRGYENLKRLILGRANEIVDDDTKKELLHNRLVRLTKRQMKMLVLYYIEAKSVRYIAKAMHTSKSTVSRQIKSIISRLRVTSYAEQDSHLEPEPPTQ